MTTTETETLSAEERLRQSLQDARDRGWTSIAPLLELTEQALKELEAEQDKLRKEHTIAMGLVGDLTQDVHKLTKENVVLSSHVEELTKALKRLQLEACNGSLLDNDYIIGITKPALSNTGEG